jgi:hypothetical protein
VPNCPEDQINLLWPRGGLKDYLNGETSSHLMTLRKRKAVTEELVAPETAKLSMEVTWKPYSGTAFKMGSYAS